MKLYEKALLGIAIAGIGIVGVVIAAYFSNFNGSLGDQTNWGTFGDYVGGTSNSLLGLLTFLGVLYTISLTYREVEAQKLQHDENLEYQNRQKLELDAAHNKQQQKEDIYRIVETIYGEIKEILATQVQTGDLMAQTTPIYRVIDIKWRDEKMRAIIIDRNEDLFNLLHDLLFQLKFYLTTYDDIAVNDYTSSYYKRYLLVAVLNLWAAERIGVELKDYYENYSVHS